MIDIHCHLLPNIDDGSDDLGKSIEQLRQMEEGGVSEVYLTSHYFRGHYHYPRQDYDAKLATLREAAGKAGLKIKLHSGFEVFIQPGIVEDIKEKGLTLGESNYVLIESELNGLPTDFYQNVYPLLRAGFKPILAHGERYVSIMKRPSKARELNDRDIYIQTNAGALLGHYGEKVRQTAWVLIDNGWTHFLASDDHVRMDYEAYFDACRLITERIDETAAKLLCQGHPSAIANHEKIPYKYVMVKHSHHREHKRGLLERFFG
ncbi:MAG: capsular biosynthesis protein [Candidatus Cloacimonetes bacterium]|jgi:protein-tyrosine phosphatase|nr:capsular biosynthesis protein [Candidatus Cloacimonadota bacterium]MDD4806568.1 capsular biosynthesis protein [Candidatus Cloacimonadota bacterium]NCB35664.1 capsular biosynthesis protein [Clostridia bacterium]